MLQDAWHSVVYGSATQLTLVADSNGLQLLCKFIADACMEWKFKLDCKLLSCVNQVYWRDKVMSYNILLEKDVWKQISTLFRNVKRVTLFEPPQEESALTLALPIEGCVVCPVQLIVYAYSKELVRVHHLYLTLWMEMGLGGFLLCRRSTTSSLVSPMLSWSPRRWFSSDHRKKPPPHLCTGPPCPQWCIPRWRSHLRTSVGGSFLSWRWSHRCRWWRERWKYCSLGCAGVAHHHIWQAANPCPPCGGLPTSLRASSQAGEAGWCWTHCSPGKVAFYDRLIVK